MRVLFSVTMLSPLLASACAVNNGGLLAGHVTHATSATVVDLYTIGADLRSWSWNSGLTLGVSRTTLIYPADAYPAEGASEPHDGWHPFHLPIPTLPPVALQHSIFGAELATGDSRFSFTLGAREATVLALTSATSSVDMRLTYAADSPAQTQVELRHREID